VCDCEHPKNNRKHDCSCKTWIIIVQSITSPRRNIAIFVRRDGLTASWESESDRLRSERDMIICLTSNCDVFGRDEFDSRSGSLD
jgi:hypothetical protein